jgi:hypothetical protein
MKLFHGAGAALVFTGLFMGALAGALTLGGCDRGDAGTPSRDHSSQSAATGGTLTSGRAPPPMLDGKPMWADNREHSATENLDYQFDHWGAALGARDTKDYARKAHAFIDHPPHVVERVTRPNGDILMYDKTADIFAIVRRDGAPRLFRKLPGGEADWEKAKVEAPAGNRSRTRYRAPGGADYSRGASD